MASSVLLKLTPILGIACATAVSLIACSTPTPADSVQAPAEDRLVVTTPSVPVISRARARWVAVSWSDLPGWADDRTRELWPALLAGCAKPASGWAAVCALARQNQPVDDMQARERLQAWLQPYRVEASEAGASSEAAAFGLATGYFEPLIVASRLPRPGFSVALHRPPPDLDSRKPYWTRRQIDTLGAAQASLAGQEIAYVPSALDALLLQVQGSGRLRMREPDGREQMVRVAYAGHNDQPYRSVGRWLVESGQLRVDEASWPAIRGWAARNPARVQEMLWSNPRVVFFRDEPLLDDRVGPKGAQGVALTPGRSVAVDALAVPYGTPLWIDTTEPLDAKPLRRVVMAQDTGSAIAGAVRIDYFWGWGERAEQQAGRMKQPLRVWALWPK